MYGIYELHVDVTSLTMTGAQRYYSFIGMFCSNFLGDNSPYKKGLQHVILYNSPAIIPALKKMFSIFVPEGVNTKIIFA